MNPEISDIRWMQRFDKEKNLIVMKVLNCRHSRNLLSGIYRARRPPTHAHGGDGFEGAGFEGDGFEGAGFEGAGFEGAGFEGAGFEGDGFEGDGFEGDGFEGDGFEGDGFEGDDVVFILERLYHHQRPDV
ncbi:MAG: hypothetical protein COA61_006890 [Zetaproteobacteria bacterium]|nr:hypothetical protein [Zetaproteobacteria bacterium]